MVGPALKREAVGHLQRALEMSERRACKVVGQPRSTQRYLVAPDTEELQLRQELRQIAGSDRGPGTGWQPGACAGAVGGSMTSGFSGCGVKKA